MEREHKPKKVVKEKRSAKKTKASKASGEARVEAEIKSDDSASAQADAKKIEVPGIEEIQLRAYFIGERRAASGFFGDSTSDWVQAERELMEEAGLK
jgi:Protein of unknown function (DUF2934)